MSKEKINDTRMLPIEALEANEGQLFGLPANPREIAEEKMELLKADIQKYPQFLKYNALKVYPIEDGKYIVIGGNMRYRALCELEFKEVPCVIIPKETHVEELKAYIILDNSSFGRWEWTKLSSDEWDSAQLQEWGVDMPIMETDVDINDFFDSLDTTDPKEKPEHIVIILPDDLRGQKGEIKNVVKEALGGYSGISFK